MHHGKIETCKIWQVTSWTRDPQSIGSNDLFFNVGIMLVNHVKLWSWNLKSQNAGKPGNWPVVSRAPHGKKRRYRVLPDVPPCWQRHAVSAKGSSSFSTMAPAPKRNTVVPRFHVPLCPQRSPVNAVTKKNDNDGASGGLGASGFVSSFPSASGFSPATSVPSFSFSFAFTRWFKQLWTQSCSDMQRCMHTGQSGAIEDLSKSKGKLHSWNRSWIYIIIKLMLTPPTTPSQQPDSSTKGSSSQFSSSPISPPSSPQSSPFSSASASWAPFISTSKGSSINALQTCSRNSSFTCKSVSNVCERASALTFWTNSVLCCAMLCWIVLAWPGMPLLWSLLLTPFSPPALPKSAKVCQNVQTAKHCTVTGCGLIIALHPHHMQTMRDENGIKAARYLHVILFRSDVIGQ